MNIWISMIIHLIIYTWYQVERQNVVNETVIWSILNLTDEHVITDDNPSYNIHTVSDIDYNLTEIQYDYY